MPPIPWYQNMAEIGDIFKSQQWLIYWGMSTMWHVGEAIQICGIGEQELQTLWWEQSLLQGSLAVCHRAEQRRVKGDEWGDSRTARGFLLAASASVYQLREGGLVTKWRVGCVVDRGLTGKMSFEGDQHQAMSDGWRRYQDFAGKSSGPAGHPPAERENCGWRENYVRRSHVQFLVGIWKFGCSIASYLRLRFCKCDIS